MKQYMIKLFILVFFVMTFSCSQTNIRRINPIGQFSNLQVAGIIITFAHGHSYDNLFTTVKQQSKNGSVVLTYTADYLHEKEVFRALTGDLRGANQVLHEIIHQIVKLSSKCPSCVVFNWQCSAQFSSEQLFPETFHLLKQIIKRGYMAMFSDFSLKALIKSWDSSFLGPNPFIKIGETNQSIKMRFNKDKLKMCPSSQLQAIAKLSQTNQLIIHVMSGTIMYVINPKVKSQLYQIDVLTIAQNLQPSQRQHYSYIDNYRGIPSHVVLNYKQGGKILTSMGHWIQLMKLQTTKQRLFQTSQQLYGSAQSVKMQKQYDALESESEKKQYISRKSKLYVQNQSPGANKILLDEQKNKVNADL